MNQTRKVVLAIVAVLGLLFGAGYAWMTLDTLNAPDRARLADNAQAPRGSQLAGQRPEGDWELALTSEDFVGYRIRERLAGVAAPNDVVGRTTQVEGSLRIASGADTAIISAANIEVDMRSLSSGVEPRDGAMGSSGLETSRFPTAAFQLTDQFDLPSLTRGSVIDLTLTGDLTLHGVTRGVEIPVQARWDGTSIKVAGGTAIRLAEYEITVDAGLAPFRIEPVGEFEFELTYVRVGSETTSVPPPVGTDGGRTGDPFEDMQAEPCTAAPNAAPPGPGVLLFAAASSSGDEAYTLDLSTGLVRALPNGGEAMEPTWTADGTAVTFTRPGGVPPLMTVTLDGQPLPTPAASVSPWMREPAWSADGTHLAYVGGPNGESEVWVVGADGRDPHRVSPAGAFSDSPSWSPANRLAFTIRDDVGNDDIATVERDGSSPQRLITSPGYEYAPAWSPDGSQIAYGRDGAIFLMQADGSGARPLTSGTYDSVPTWAPDGSRLVFLRQGSLYMTTPAAAPVACVASGLSVVSAGRWQLGPVG